MKRKSEEIEKAKQELILLYLGIKLRKESDVNHIYCYNEVLVKKETSSDDNSDNSYYSQPETDEKYYYEIATRIAVDVPIIKNVVNIIPQNIFWVTGNTKSYYKK